MRLALAGGQLEILPCRSPVRAQRFPQVSEDACLSAMQLVLPDGRIVGGADAVPELLRRIRGLGWLAGLFALPLVRPVSRRAYACIASNRMRISCAGHPTPILVRGTQVMPVPVEAVLPLLMRELGEVPCWEHALTAGAAEGRVVLRLALQVGVGAGDEVIGMALDPGVIGRHVVGHEVEHQTQAAGAQPLAKAGQGGIAAQPFVDNVARDRKAGSRDVILTQVREGVAEFMTPFVMAA